MLLSPASVNACQLLNCLTLDSQPQSRTEPQHFHQNYLPANHVTMKIDECTKVGPPTDTNPEMVPMEPMKTPIDDSLSSSSSTISPVSSIASTLSEDESTTLSPESEPETIAIENGSTSPVDDDLILLGKNSQLDDIKLVSAYIEKCFTDPHKAVETSGLKLYSNHFHLRRDDGTELRIYKHSLEMLTKCVITPKLYREQFYAEMRARMGPHFFDIELNQIYTLDPMEEPSFTLFSRQNILDFGRRAAEIQIGGSRRVPTGSHDFYHVLINIMRGLVAQFGMSEVDGTYYCQDNPEVFTTRVGPVELRFGYNIGAGVHDQGRIHLRVDPTFEYFGGRNNLLFMLNGSESIAAVKKRFCGSKIKAKYSRKMYYIIDFDWTLTPTSPVVLTENGVFISPIEQYRRIGVHVSRYQPLMRCAEIDHDDVSTSNGKPQQELLVPETHHLVGLLDEMHEQLQSARDYETQELNPKARYAESSDFKDWLKDHPVTKETLANLGLKITDHPVTSHAAVLPKVKLRFGDGKDTPNSFGRWAHALNAHPLAQPVDLVEWSLIYPTGVVSQACINEALNKMKAFSATLGFNFKEDYLRKIELSNPTIDDYVDACENLSLVARQKITFILVCIPKDGASVLEKKVRRGLKIRIGFYREIVFRFLVLEDVIKDDFLMRHFIADVNVSFGGIPWTVDFGADSESVEGLMIVGFDKGHTFAKKCSAYDSLGRPRMDPITNWQSVIVGTTVSSINNNFTKYYSRTFKFDRDGEMGNLVKLDFMKCLRVYKNYNDEQLPSRIIYYRDSVDDVELEDVKEIELDQLLTILTMQYKKNLPEFTYIVVNRSDYTRLFDTTFNSAPVGTVVDSTITFANRNDFYLLSAGDQPTYYHVIHDTSQLGLRGIESLTYKFCHLSFDGFESTSVPAPVHNARIQVAAQVEEINLKHYK